MSFQTNVSVDNQPSNPLDPTDPIANSSNQRARLLRSHESLLLLQSIPATHRTAQFDKGNGTQQDVTPTPDVLLKRVPRCEDLWFEDGDVIIWADDEGDSMLYRVHRRVLKESGAEPFCTVVNCHYPDPKTSNETFLDGVWVLKYTNQDPTDIMYVLKWMYERPSISKRSTVPFAALEVYLERSEIHFVPAMRRCALEYLWNMLPTSLNYHQRVPTFVEDCYSEHPTLFYKPHVLLSLVSLSTRFRLVAILPLLYYYLAQWPLDWITDGVPACLMGYGVPSPHDPEQYPLPLKHAIIVLGGRDKLIRMRETRVFNFVESFTSSGIVLDVPTEGCDRRKRKETWETCFEWLMRVWFFMSRCGFTARPSALDIMSMGQWKELRKNCCEACAQRVMEHMLDGRDYVWKAIPGIFGGETWDLVVEQQKEIEKDFEAEIC